MSAGKSVADQASAVRARLNAPGLAAKEVVAAIIASWRQGQPIDAPRALAEHPELVAAKSLVLDLANEEYCLRAEAGETLDLHAFCERFPAFRNSIYKLLDAHCFFEENPRLLTRPRPASWPQVGETFLGFELLRELGRGAFARVYLAGEIALGKRHVVVKIARRGAAEANTLGRLQHPNIVPIHSVHQDASSELTAICMPYRGSATLDDVLERIRPARLRPVTGQSLRQAIRDASQAGVPFEDPVPCPPPRHSYTDEVIELGQQLAEALAFAHARGVCHGDLKPSNILLSPAGRPLLLDFNLSLDVYLPEQLVGGTLPYMSPEQLRAFFRDIPRSGPPLDARSDLFSLGVILYELLTGVHPFPEDQPAGAGRPAPEASSGPVGSIPASRSPSASRQPISGRSLPDRCRRLFERQRQGPRPVRQADPRIDKHLACLLERCLAFEPEARFQSAVQLARVLQEYLSCRQRLRRWVARHQRPLLTAGVLVWTAGLAGAYGWARRDPYSVRQVHSGWEVYQRGDYEEALAFFGRAAQADPRLAEAFFARGRAYQQLGDVQSALLEYEKADRLVSDGRIMACMGYCLSRLNLERGAIAQYVSALEAGYTAAEVFNNLGHCQLRVKQLDAAQQSLEEAIQRDPSLQAAFHNRLKLHGRQALRQASRLPTVWQEDIHKALALGPGTAELYLDVARLYALATRRNRHWVEQALDSLERCLDLGQNPLLVRQDPLFSAVRDESRFQQLINRPLSPEPCREAVLLLDPLPKHLSTIRPSDSLFRSAGR